jgi:hypothetical protein
MAIQIPRVTGRRVLDTTGPVPQIDSRPVEAPNLGAALTTAGINVQAVENRRMAEQEQAEISRAGLALASARAKWTDELRTREEAAPLGAPEFSVGVLKDFDADVGKLAGEFQSERARNYLQQSITEFRTTLGSSAARFETEARTRKITAEQAATIDENRKFVRGNWDAYGEIVKDHDAYLDNSGLSENFREPLRQSARELLADSATTGFVEKDPYAAVKALRADDSGLAFIAGLSPEARERQINAAETEIRRREAEARTRQIEARQGLTDRLQDLTTAATLGLPITDIPSKAELTAAYGAEDGARRAEQVTALVRMGSDVATLHQQPTSEVVKLLESYRPTEQEGATADAQRYGLLARAADQVIKARDTDPAGYLQRYSPAVARVWQQVEAGEQGAPQRYLAVVRAERERLGLPGNDVLPKAYAEALVDRISAPQPDESLAARLSAEADRWGPAWPEVYRQVATKLPDTAFVIGSGLAPTTAQTLAAVSTMKDDDKVTATGSPMKAVRDRVSSQLEEFRESFGVSNARTAVAVERAAVDLAYGYMMAGASESDAVNRATQELVSDRYSFTKINGKTLRVPAGVDVDTVEVGAEAFMDTFKLPSGTVQTLPGLPEEEALAQAEAAIKAGGYWRTAPDESGLRLYVGTAPVPGLNGKPVQLSWGELTALGTGRFNPERNDMAFDPAGLGVQ